jgi:hypothetical protein
VITITIIDPLTFCIRCTPGERELIELLVPGRLDAVTSSWLVPAGSRDRLVILLERYGHDVLVVDQCGRFRHRTPTAAAHRRCRQRAAQRWLRGLCAIEAA